MDSATPTSDSPRASVIIPAYESQETIANTLRGLRAQEFAEFETVVVDSSPGDATEVLVEAEFPEVTYERSARRLIPHEARNRGVELARGELLVFTDPDCVPHPDWIRRLVRVHDAGHPIVAGAIEDAGSKWFDRGVHLTKFSPWIAGGAPGPRADLATANLLWSRSVWERFGPFPTNRWCGDTELCWRARERGIELRFEPAAVVDHEHEVDFRGFLRERRARGEDFGGMRAAHGDWSRLAAAARAVAFPLVPLVLLGRGLANAARAGRLREGLATAPLQLAGYAAWALGEARAYLRAARGSTDGR
jgi:GT2 family glycosyltransferase